MASPLLTSTVFTFFLLMAINSEDGAFVLPPALLIACHLLLAPSAACAIAHDHSRDPSAFKEERLWAAKLLPGASWAASQLTWPPGFLALFSYHVRPGLKCEQQE